MKTQFLNDNGPQIINAGTSEGAHKGWETRKGGTGRMGSPHQPTKVTKKVSAENASREAEEAEKKAIAAGNSDRDAFSKASAAHKVAAKVHNEAALTSRSGKEQNEHWQKADQHRQRAKDLRPNPWTKSVYPR